MYELRTIGDELKATKGSDFFSYFELYLNKNLVQIDDTFSIELNLYDDETIVLTKALVLSVLNNEIQLYLLNTETDIDIKKYNAIISVTIGTELYKFKDIDFFIE